MPRLTGDQKALEDAPSDKMPAVHRAFHLSFAAAAGDRLIKLIGEYIDAAARYPRVEAALEETVAEDRYEHRASGCNASRRRQGNDRNNRAARRWT